MNRSFARLSPRKRAITKIAGVVLGGALVLAGINYSAAHIPSVGGYLISQDPGSYMTEMSEYLDTHHADAGRYGIEVSRLVVSANSLPSLSADDRFYLFSSNASQVDAGEGLDVCEAQVVARADDSAKLEYVIGSVERTDKKYYLEIVGKMAERVGTDLYKSIESLFRK